MLAGRVAFVTGASRGIGRAIAERLAADGAKVVIAAKTLEDGGKLSGSLRETEARIRARGGQCACVQLDVRNEGAIEQAVSDIIAEHSCLDILVNNVSGISRTGTLETPAKKFDLLFQLNVRATYVTSRAAITGLLRSQNPHILMISPPVPVQSHWWSRHFAYSFTKLGMSYFAQALGEEFSGRIAVNTLWPETLIATDAMLNFPEVDVRRLRIPDVVADAVSLLIQNTTPGSSGFHLAEEVLARYGGADLRTYNTHPDFEPLKDIFLD